MSASTELVTYPATYGGKPCRTFPTHWQYGPLKGSLRYDLFFVMLDKDPGFGSMNFPNIHRSQLVFIVEPPTA